ncbi:hypothetical protein HDU85_005036 [Gaertneriomyces sp. JEL0708]|nr:hypothetical protein HDU85_005036 [Gaertneriomyces sp. JEL0708]
MHLRLQKANTGVLAFIALVTVQTAVGPVYKSSQTDGRYGFSQASALALAELLKFCISIALYLWTHKDQHAYGVLGTSPTGTFKQRFNLGNSWRSLRAEIGAPLGASLGCLAALYCFNNHLTFYLYQQAHPGIIQLVESGSTLISAIMLYLFFARIITPFQWAAVIAQVVGFVIAQSGEHGTAHPASVYGSLLLSTTITSACSCINDHLLKKAAALHAQNAVMYAAGLFLNLAYYLCLANRPGSTEPGFFEGYDNPLPFMVVVMNCIVGIVIAFVYKYADAVVKCAAVAVTAAVLILASAMFRGAPITLLTFIGSIIVFASTYVYFRFGSKSNESPEKLQLKSRRVFGSILVTSFAFGLGILAFGRDASVLPTGGINSTVAVIRFNAARPERILWMQKYTRHFKHVVISSPEGAKIQQFLNTLVHDDKEFSPAMSVMEWDDPHTTYEATAQVLQTLLNDSTVTGVMYFHFDMWINPSKFDNANLTMMLAPHPGLAPAGGRRSAFQSRCLTPEEFPSISKKEPWWVFRTFVDNMPPGFAEVQSAVAQSVNNYATRPNEYCFGWADFYHLPRTVFEDFIYLADIFYKQNVFHEVALPT